MLGVEYVATASTKSVSLAYRAVGNLTIDPALSVLPSILHHNVPDSYAS